MTVTPGRFQTGKQSGECLLCFHVLSLLVREVLSSQEQIEEARRMVLPWAEGCDHSYYYYLKKTFSSSFHLLNADNVSKHYAKYFKGIILFHILQRRRLRVRGVK